MKELIRVSESSTRKTKKCLSCGTTENMGRRRYCSAYCRQRLGYKLDMRIGLVQALNIRYATFYFSDRVIAMDLLPYGSKEIFSFFYPRSPGKTPAEDFSRMADILGHRWWAEKQRTNKRYLASRYVLEQAIRNPASKRSVKPVETVLPSFRGMSMTYLKLEKADLDSSDLSKVIKDAYRRQVKIHHPDMGGDAESFRKIHQAYVDLLRWSKHPTFSKRRGFPDKWFYDGNKNRWVQPVP